MTVPKLVRFVKTIKYQVKQLRVIYG